MTISLSLATTVLLLSPGLTTGPFEANERLFADSGGMAAAQFQSRQGNQRQMPNQRQQPNQRQPQSRSGGLSFRYDQVTIWGGTEDLDEDGPEGDSLRLDVSLSTGPASYFYLNWQEGEYEALGERTTREVGFGFQEHYADRTSFFITAGYLQDRWSGDDEAWADGNMLRGRYGMRARPTDRIELDGAIVYTRGTGSTDMDSRWSMDIGLSLYFTDHIALRFSSLDIDGLQPTQLMGLRLEWGE
ncbi:hypothetical protein [Natronospira bacteriovora]|uniref:Uncharacterized protein n=1 Tax=Natronospira bacteriovora TaxID=3069753 RepID=A0ABU0W9G4_9GAMM|nr:hypothetical protein [Natronospira sp. AB-CW4]MDQ2070641.1 hypothetical protein [Natronospira sp. AB-CW4]